MEKIYIYSQIMEGAEEEKNFELVILKIMRTLFKPHFKIAFDKLKNNNKIEIKEKLFTNVNNDKDKEKEKEKEIKNDINIITKIDNNEIIKPKPIQKVEKEIRDIWNIVLHIIIKQEHIYMSHLMKKVHIIEDLIVLIMINGTKSKKKYN